MDILSLARGYGYEPEKAGRKAVHMKHSGGLYIFPENNRFFQWTGPDDQEMLLMVGLLENWMLKVPCLAIVEQ